jgi:excinuclease ABC subunit A
MSHIELRGVRVNNLQGIDLRLPIGKLIAITGVSGAGKSSLAFDTLVAEGQRRYIETFAPSARQFLERIERPDADTLENLPPAIAVPADDPRDVRATLGSLTETDELLRMLFARHGQVHCPVCQVAVTAFAPADVDRDLGSLAEGTRFVVAFRSDNSDESIANWKSLGFVRTIELPGQPDQILVVVDRLTAKATQQPRVLEAVEQAYRYGHDTCCVLVEASETLENVWPWENRHWHVRHFARRLICGQCGEELPPLEPELFNPASPLGVCRSCCAFTRLKRTNDLPSDPARRRNKANKAETRRKQVSENCSDCGNSRLNPVARQVRLSLAPISEGNHPAEVGIVELLQWPLAKLSALVTGWRELGSEGAFNASDAVLAELQARLNLLLDLGLGHLALNRSSATLSRGERQRARLAGVLATRLDNALYVLDEPSGGLHPRDATRVLSALQRLRQAGNTVVMIEHSQAFIEAADEVIELGPAAGRDGGRVVRQVTHASNPLPREEGDRRPGAEHVAASLNASTVPHVAPLPLGEGTERDGCRLRLEGAALHNLCGIDVEFPLNKLCVVTGVSGSGKSSLIKHTLYPALCQRVGLSCPVAPVGQFTGLSGAEAIENVVLLDASPLAHSARANAATMLHLWDEIRQLFATSTDAKVKNFTARHFSLHAHDGGRCPRCRGRGEIEIDLQFLANLSMRCPLCNGSRFQAELLEVKLRGLSIAEVLQLTAAEAFTFFRGQPTLQRRLKPLKDVGLGYLPLGQSATTLSRGERQRLRLASLLANRSRKRTLFLIDEPAAGLHARDIAVLLQCFRHLLEVGHSLIVIEHRTEFLREADWIIELGPAAGDAGGQIVRSEAANRESASSS